MLGLAVTSHERSRAIVSLRVYQPGHPVSPKQRALDRKASTTGLRPPFQVMYGCHPQSRFHLDCRELLPAAGFFPELVAETCCAPYAAVAVPVLALSQEMARLSHLP